MRGALDSAAAAAAAAAAAIGAAVASTAGDHQADLSPAAFPAAAAAAIAAVDATATAVAGLLAEGVADSPLPLAPLPSLLALPQPQLQYCTKVLILCYIVKFIFAGRLEITVSMLFLVDGEM